MNLGYEQRFYDLNYKFKSNVKKEFVKALQTKSLGEIICNEISVKYKKIDKNKNTSIYNQLKGNEILNNIFSENYLSFFKNIYYKNIYSLKIRYYGKEKNINLSKNVKSFKDLSMEKIRDDIDDLVKKYFFCSKFRINKQT